MPDNQVQPVPRGKTFYGDRVIDPLNYGTSVQLEGTQTVFKNTDPSDRTKLRNAADLKCILVRNTTGGILFRGQAVAWAAGFRGRRVNALVSTTAQEIAGFVDDHLPTSGVRDGDMFWLIVEGDVLVPTPMAGAGFNGDWSAGNLLYALTAAGTTLGSTAAAGRLSKWNGTFSAAQTTDGTAGLILANRAGRAISAATTGETNATRLINVKLF